MVICKICGNKMSEYGHAEILNKYDITYYMCEQCGFIQTEDPYWLGEAYSSAIADSDIGLLSRNIMLSKNISGIINGVFNDAKTFLDYGGGYGIFTRIMRDNGFDFEWYDKYCKNIFAVGHERKRMHYDVVTAFEFMEHLPNPREVLGELFACADNIICSTELIPLNKPDLNNWWYFCLDHGQHVSFYTEKAMIYLAQMYGKYYARCGSTHVFSRSHISGYKLSLCCRFPRLVNKLRRRASLLPVDYEALTGKKI
ncbi:class I SAM-dependent methyltransferase [Schwartzia succinivorans]|uniref:Methyltransferase domain-containing protein n=1 Tax=Schwartzia succinivorans DSM 10502 TaxID=1123243 RepID=A0A1M4XQV2_9FIRM|nr:class I SAM-dependent methyltransferase [Schwartzia succinivorans]SHE95947.1 Methyltransferase domain-containing protein [Schwartzia succinivorans DSM 10502]